MFERQGSWELAVWTWMLWSICNLCSALVTSGMVQDGLWCVVSQLFDVFVRNRNPLQEQVGQFTDAHILWLIDAHRAIAQEPQKTQMISLRSAGNQGIQILSCKPSCGDILVRNQAYYSNFVCKISDLTKQCIQLDMTDCRLEKLRAAVSASSTCQSLKICLLLAVWRWLGVFHDIMMISYVVLCLQFLCQRTLNKPFQRCGII